MTTKSRLSPEKLAEIDKKCVCSICTCGRHKCPKKAVKFEGDTIYHNDYVPHKINQGKKEPCKHHYKERHYDPDLIKTSYESTYTPKHINSDNTKKKTFEYRPKTGRFYGSTQYGDSYIPKQIQVDPSKNYESHHHYTPKPGKFEGTSTYNAQFTPKRAQTGKAGQRPRYQKRNVPFEGRTTYHQDYVPKKIEGNNSTNCNKTHYPTRKTKFEGQSAYKQEYKPHRMPRNQHCPILDLPQPPRQCSPGKNHLNFISRKNQWQ